jgi:hypothetical protein
MATACYIPDYLPASYKGVPFDAMTAESEHGRRGAVGEFPFGENTAYADLGRKNRTYSLRARFVENDHVLATGALIAAVESAGSGPLVHPTRGLVQAACKSMKVKDDLFDEVGVTYADLEFIEANDWPAGLSLGSTIFGTTTSLVLGAVEAVFLAGYTPRSVPSHRRTAVLDTAAAAVSTVRNEYAAANPNSTDLRVMRILADYDTILADHTLLADPKIVHTAIAGGLSAISRQVIGEDKYDAMRRVANSVATAANLPSKAGQSQEAVYTLMRVNAGAYLGQAALERRFATVDEALLYLDTATAVLSSEAKIAYDICNNDLFMELRRYIVSLSAQIYRQAYLLPGIVSYDFYGGVHPLVAAYAIYGDAKQLRELERSNIVGANGRFNSAVVGVG